jgi:hypothetical protein
MGFLDSLKSMFAGESQPQGEVIYVRCKKCGEIIQSRIDIHNHLSQQDDGTYLVRKTLVGNQRCFERLEVTLYYNAQRHLVDQQVVRGDFVTAEEYENQAGNRTP